MENPGRLIQSTCEWCGRYIGPRWYDACCNKQYDKYREEVKAFNAAKEKESTDYVDCLKYAGMVNDGP